MNYESLLQDPDKVRSLFIAEAGINHDGSIEEAKRMIDAAAEAGADYVKFQSFKANDLVTPNSLTSSYIDKGSHKGETFRDLLKRLEISVEDHHELRAYCKSKNIKFLSTAFHHDSFDLLMELGIDVVKVASGDLTNLPLLRHMASAKLPMIISTGMATLGDIEDAIETVNKAGNDKIILLHCISWYPAPIESTNLNFMRTLKNAFGYPVGYSDHTLGINMTIAARAMGAVVFEKHYTMDSKRFGPDHAASIEPHELNALLKGIREVEAGLGTTRRMFSDLEIGQRKVHRRSVVVNKPVKKGEVLTEENLIIKRPGIGIRPKYLEDIVGRRARQDLDKEQLLDWGHIE